LNNNLKKTSANIKKNEVDSYFYHAASELTTGGVLLF